MRRGAFTLAETILAIFIMVGAMVVFGMLMHAMLNYGTRAQQRAMAALAAQSKLEEIREWANTGNNFQTGWPYTNQTSTDPAFPDITLLAQTEDQVLTSPCTELEKKSGSPRRINQSCKKVRVTASWPQDGGQPVRVVTFMAAPDREPNPALSVSGAVPGTLSAGGSFVVSASAVDTTGQPLRDLFFSWSSLPTGTSPGNGTAVALNSDTGRFTNGFQPQTGGPIVTVPGTCKMGAVAFYRGRVLTGASGAFTLQP